MWKWVKVPKIVALVAFVLPWMTVSCSGTPLVTASGWQLAFGQFSVAIPQAGAGAPPASPAEINGWLIAALLLAVAGAAVAFLKFSKQFSLVTLATSAAALVLILIGTNRYSKGTIAADAARNGGADAQTLAMIQVEWHPGYWLALAALLAAGVLSWMAYSGKTLPGQASALSDPGTDEDPPG